MQLLIGLALAALIAVLAHRRGSLSRSGALGAVLIGTAVFGFGGLAWGTLLVVFFVSSSGLSHFRETQKERLAEKFSKGHQRDLAQTLANGGAGALLAVAAALLPGAGLPWWALFAGAMATVNADTWATELGVLSRTPPRLVTSGRPVEVGTSGGLTWLGTLAALGGAALIGLSGAGFMLAAGEPASHALGLALAASLGGLGGSLLDSLLGATVQAIYFCDTCGKETERHPTHRCGAPTRRIRGWTWLDNDWVNFLSSVGGSLLTALLMRGL